MSAAASVISAVHHLTIAKQYFEDFCRQNPGTKGSNLLNGYVKRIDWICNDMVTHPFLPEQVRHGIKEEINSDVWTVPAIAEKISQLKPESREAIEELLETLINGAELIVETKKDTENG